MPAYQVVPGKGAYERRPRRVRNTATGHWLAGPVSAAAEPEWTAIRAEGRLWLPVTALRQIDLLAERGIDADME